MLSSERKSSGKVFAIDSTGKLATEHFTDLVKTEFSDGGLVLGSSKFSILPQLPSKIMLNSKVVQNQPKNNNLDSLI